MAQEAPNLTLQTVGDYELIEKIAEGGMGTVYKGRHRETGDIVAIKVVSPHMANNPVLLRRFEQEYNAAKQLDHPNIVKAIAFGSAGSTPYLVMEFVDGETLGQKVERDGAMPEKDAIRLIAQVAQGLHRAHKEKLIHRDVKPDNVLVSREGVAKLADLGLVKEVEADLNLTRTGRGLGTPHFMAPEQFKNAKNVDARCDIYSLGATLYMMVTGELPFKSSGPLDAYMKKIENKLTPPKEVKPNLSERIDWAIRRAMSAEPDQRPANCREFVEDLTGKSTRKVTSAVMSALDQADVWYLTYKNEEGVAQTVKGTTGAIRRSLKDRLLGDASNIRACRTRTGTFEPLRGFPEFRDLVLALGPAAPAAGAQTAADSKEPTPDPDSQPTVPAAAAIIARAPHIKIPSSRQNAGWPLWLQGVVIGVLVFVIIFLLGLYVFRN
jgi:eukaryotic-like serine/threonine-protein kinase